MHARLFQKANYRANQFQPVPESTNPEPYLDGHPQLDRPLFVQFCANDPEDLFKAAQFVAPYCDAVDLNLGCPQGIARKGKYGAFLQEDWALISSLIRRCHESLSVPITAKMRILSTRERTLDYARMIVSSGASILTVHGRTRDQKGHNVGLADWDMIRYLRDNLPPETVLFANGNVRRYEDIDECLAATGADGLMSAEGNLRNPAIFYPAPEPSDAERNGFFTSPRRSGWRLDFMFRRYLDLVYMFVLDRVPPPRKTAAFHPPLPSWIIEASRPKKMPLERSPKDKRTDPNLHPMRSHLFSLLEDMYKIPQFFPIRDAMLRTRVGVVEDYEPVLEMIENAVEAAILEQGEDDEVWWVCGEDITKPKLVKPKAVTDI